jgi:hypothetical protein
MFCACFSACHFRYTIQSQEEAKWWVCPGTQKEFSFQNYIFNIICIELEHLDCD